MSLWSWVTTGGYAPGHSRVSEPASPTSRRHAKYSERVPYAKTASVTYEHQCHARRFEIHLLARSCSLIGIGLTVLSTWSKKFFASAYTISSSRNGCNAVLLRFRLLPHASLKVGSLGAVRRCAFTAGSIGMVRFPMQGLGTNASELQHANGTKRYWECSASEFLGRIKIATVRFCLLCAMTPIYNIASYRDRFEIGFNAYGCLCKQAPWREHSFGEAACGGGVTL